MSDTAILRVDGQSLERLKIVMALAPHREAKGYCIDENRFVLFWASHDKMVPFPVPLDMARCAEIVFAWLESEDCNHGLPMDHDGDSEKGWLCYHDEWGHIDGFGWPAFLAVTPCWQHYGK